MVSNGMLEEIHVGLVRRPKRLQHLTSMPSPPPEAAPELRQTRSEPGSQAMEKVPVHKDVDRIQQDAPPHVAVKYGDTIRLRTKLPGTTELGSVGTYDLASSFFQLRGNLNWTTHKCHDLACIAPLSEAGFHESYFRIVPECYYGHLKSGSPVSYGDVVCLVDAADHIWNNKVGTAFNGYFGPSSKDANLSGTMSVAFLLPAAPTGDDDDGTVPVFQENRIMYYGDTNVVIQVVDSNRLRLGFNRLVTTYRKKNAPLTFGGFLRCDGRGSLLHLEIHGVPPPKILAVHVVDGLLTTPVASDVDDMLSASMTIVGPPSATVEILFTDQGRARVTLRELALSHNQPFYAVVENGQRPVRLQLVALRKTTAPLGACRRGISPLTAMALAYLALIGHAYFKGAIVVTSVYGAVVLAALPLLVTVKVCYLERLYAPLLAKTEPIDTFELSVLAWEASQAERLAKRCDDAAGGDDVPRRFLVAEGGDPVKAAARYADTLAWRAKNDMDSMLTRVQPQYHTIRRFYKQGIHKTDKLGHPIFIEKMGSIDMKGLQANGVTLPDLFRHYLFNMEYVLRFVTKTPCPCVSCSESHTCKMLIILDARGLGMRDLAGESLEFVKNCTSAMQRHYPQQSFKIFLVNVPSWFGMIWKCIKPLLHEATRAKTFILSEAETAATLLQYVDAEALPEEYGGSCHCDGGCLDHSEFHARQIAFVDALSVDPDHHVDDGGLDELSEEESDDDSTSPDESPTKKTLGTIMRRHKAKTVVLKSVVKQEYLLMRLVKHKPFVNPIGLRRLVSLTDHELCIQKSPKDAPVKYTLGRNTVVRPYHKPNCFEVVLEANLSMLLFTETSQALDAWIQAVAHVIHEADTSA
ncbi:phosphoinositol transporter [Achlya hypogyna]|uniref:Phosphoinositol transporter n=1 Tax=Achlya hypogyna TaxID=1202772 RepID=A0A1V9YMZ1_ACHHY|nr:phosphoinositol transporter [Achlya hypogyna]